MEITQRLNDDIKKSMLSKDKERLSALRDIKSKILLESTSGSGVGVSEEKVALICMKLHKQRMETYQLYIDQNRSDLADEELFQAKVIEEYLPKMLSEDEVVQMIQSAKNELHAEGMKDMGKMMGHLTTKVAGKFDGKLLSEMVRKSLQNS